MLDGFYLAVEVTVADWYSSRLWAFFKGSKDLLLTGTSHKSLQSPWGSGAQSYRQI